jgi:endonuclease I
MFGRFALADAYYPPSNYYDYATGTTGTTLKQRLRATIDTVDDAAIPNTAEVIETSMSYDSARSSLQVTDADSAHSGHIITVYDRTSLNVSSFNTSGIPGWDGGTTWNREHTWPRSRGVGSSGPDDSDLFGLRPALTANNGDRGNLNYGGAIGQPWGVVSDGGSKWYPGDADAGMIARQEFYMATRYDGTETNTTDLELFSGDPSTAQGLGDINRLLEWHFAATPDTFERNRNQVIFTSYQHNRNPFIDHPEYVWSIFAKDGLGNPIPNDSQVTIAAPTTVNTTTGSSTKTVNLTNIIVGGVVPSAQNVTINKAGNNGTYYSVTTDGLLATSSISGRFNAFRTNQADSKTFSVGLNTTSATAGPRTGTVTIDNLDITAGTNGGVGHAANDANDVITVNLNVLDHALPSFTSLSQSLSRTIDFGNVALGSVATPATIDVFNLNAPSGFTAALDLDSVTPAGDTSVFTTDLASFTSLAAGSTQAFTSSFNVSARGSFLATYTLNLSDENLSGATNKTLTLTLKGVARLAGDFNNDGSVDAGDYVVWQRSFGQSVATAYSGADGDGNLTIDNADFDVWRAHFGQTAPGSSQSLSASVPEPATAWLLFFSAVFVCHCLRRTR